MDWKLFAGTFGLIFLAELGDKTQLTAMATSAGSKSPWSVFAGASAALVMSTLVATLFGSTLQRLIPPHILKGGAAILFFIFGTFLLYTAFKEKQVSPPIKAEKPLGPAHAAGFLTKTIYAAAQEFESAAVENYQQLATQTEDPLLKKLLLHLAEEEQSHLHHLHQLSSSTTPKETKWEKSDIPHTVAPPSAITEESPEHTILSKAIAHEQSTAKFYSELAKAAPIAAIKEIFLSLAQEEETHVAHLIVFQDTGTYDPNHNKNI